MNNKRFCGLDIHKDTIYACVRRGAFKSRVREFGTTTSALKELVKWLKERDVGKVAMESTGIYWIPVWRGLEEHFELILVNPYFIKQIPGRKSDVKDAQWIATLLEKGLLTGSLVPQKTIRVLRSYLRRYAQLQGQMTRCVQQVERQLSQMNIKIASMTSKIGSKTVMDIVRSIVERKYNMEDLLPLVHPQVRNRHGVEQVEKALEGIIDDHDIFLLEQIYSDFEHIKEQSEALLEQADRIVQKQYKKEMELLQTIPGISKLSATVILAETGGNVEAFATANHLTGWCGLRPKNDESAGRIKNRTITKGNKYLRRIMVQTAWAASRTKGCYLKEKYEKLAVRKSRKKALIAIARKQLVIVWNVLRNEQVYKEPVLKLSISQIQQKEKYYLDKLRKLRKLESEKVG